MQWLIPFNLCNYYKIRKIPKDFVPLKAASRLDPTEIRQRLDLWREVLDVREGGEYGKEPDRVLTAEVMVVILDTMKELTYQLAKPFIDTHFGEQFNKRYPNVTYGGTNHKIHTINDFCEWIYQFDPDLPGSTLTKEQGRAMAHHVCYGMWGKGNHWAEKGELQILRLLGFEWNGNKMCDKIVRKRKQKGGFAKAYLVKRMDMERAKVRSAWERTFLELLGNRDVFKAPKIDPETGESMSKKEDRSHLRKYLVFCKFETDGFNGSYLLSEGNPKRKEIDALENPAVAAQTKKREEEAKEKEQLIQFICTKIRNGTSIAAVIDDISKSASSAGSTAGSTGNAGNAGNSGIGMLAALLQQSRKRCPVPEAIAVAAVPPAKKQRASQSGGESTVSASDDSQSQLTMLSDAEQLAAADDLIKSPFVVSIGLEFVKLLS